MIPDLLSLRALVVSADEELRRLFRHAAAALPVPIEVVEAADGSKISTDGVDLLYLDGALPQSELSRVATASRAAAKPPFSLQLVAGGAVPGFETDGLASRPLQPDEATWLLERTVRLRLPSRVLVVDDSPTIRAIVRKTLAATRFPFEVGEAKEGRAALELVRGGAYDIVFLDYNMPGFDGLKTLSELKREECRVNVVMMTSTPHEELTARARTLGAVILKKPFFPTDIETALSDFFGLRALNPKRR